MKIIAAIGKPEFVTSDMVKEGAVVVDVGTTRVKDDTTKLDKADTTVKKQSVKK